MKSVFAAALLLLTACASTPPAAGPASVPTSDARDCAVFAVVLREHYRVDDKTAYRLQRGDAANGADYLITCDFAAAGIPVRDYDYAHVNGPGRDNFQPWLSLQRPEYPTPDTATVAAGSLIGPLAGSGVLCHLNKTGAAWTLSRCDQAWIS